MLRVLGHREAEAEVEYEYEHIGLRRVEHPKRVFERRCRGAENVEKSNDADESCGLECPDDVVHERRNDDPESLRQDDLAGLLPVSEAGCVGGFILAERDRLQATANDFRCVSTEKQDHSELCPKHLVDGEFLWHEQRKHQ